MRLYVSGPITHMPELNKPVFTAVSASLRGAGHQVVNPHEIGAPSEQMLPWESYLRAALVAMLLGADAIALLSGWERSRGATLEHHVATVLGWEVRPWTDWL